MDNPLNLPPELLDIHLRLERGGRLSTEQAHTLFECEDILTVAAMADAVAQRKWGGRAFFGTPFRVALRRLCKGSCTVCDAAPDTLDAMVADAMKRRPHELHLVGLPEDVDLHSIGRAIRGLREALGDCWMQGFTAGEIARLADCECTDVETVLQGLQQAGLDAILGTHEEIYIAAGRALVHDTAIEDERALDIHAAAHRAGLTSIATLAYKPSDATAELIARMDALRNLQRKTAGFSVFAPLPFDLDAGQRAGELPSGYEDIRLLAVGRLFFDNIPHMRLPWLALGLKMGQVALSFGGDDLGWTPFDPHVRAYAPATTFCSLTAGELERAAQAARRRATHVDGAFRERPRPTASMVASSPPEEAASCTAACASDGGKA